MTLSLATVIAFLLGSFPSGLVLPRLLTGYDIRRHGSGNIGASNVSSNAGLPLGIAVGILDILKGVAAVLLGQALGMGTHGLVLMALAAVLGHNFSIFLHFRGGKGVATSFGVALALTPIATILGMTTWLVGALVLGYASAASLLALALLPIYMEVTGSPRAYVVLGGLLFVLATVRHWENLLRLSQGQEPGIRLPWRSAR